MRETLRKPVLWGLVGLLVVLVSAVGQARADDRGRGREREMDRRDRDDRIVIFRDRDRSRHHDDGDRDRFRRSDDHSRRPPFVRHDRRPDRSSLYHRPVPRDRDERRRVTYPHHRTQRRITTRYLAYPRFQVYTHQPVFVRHRILRPHPVRSGLNFSIIIDLR
ncbi:MAG: hypothetical protein ACP5HU_00765 [Phycisphaerae bacterium]